MASCGIFYLTENSRGNLPLVSTSLHTTIKATALHTHVTQIFNNSSDQNISSCRYEFPLYDGISVVKFTCTIGNRKLSGVVHEKIAAKKIYEDARKIGETAGLLEQNSKASDVFSTSLGNIQAGEKVLVEIEYIGELKMEDLDGLAPSTSTGTTTKGGMNITVDVLMWEDMRIDGLTSPSHPIAVTIGALSTATENRGNNKASATLAQESAALEKDFVLLVNVKNLGNPKAMLETHSTISNHRALMISLVPKFILPSHRPEIVFVVDRSGSMRDNMAMVISAMKVFLRSLPPGTYFNICSFGSRYEFLWPQSKQNSAEILEEVLERIKTFQSDFGGTQRLEALTATIKNRLLYLPLEIMLLTDGDIWQQSQCFEYLSSEVKQSQGAIRVFPLGIGNAVSHSLINGIARAGNGFSQTVQNGEIMESSVVRMLRGALSPHITNYTMEIKYEAENDDFEIIERVTDSMKLLLSDRDEEVEPSGPQMLPTISLFNPTMEDIKDTFIEDALPQKLPNISTPKLIQAPHEIPSLFTGVNTVVYLLMSPETIQRNPKAVVLKGTSAHGPVELSIPIESLPVPANTIHQLAARRATQDLEEAVAENDVEGIDKEKLREMEFGNINEAESERFDFFTNQTGQHYQITETRADRPARAEYRSYLPMFMRSASQAIPRPRSSMFRSRAMDSFTATSSATGNTNLTVGTSSNCRFATTSSSKPALRQNKVPVAPTDSSSRIAIEKDWAAASSLEIVLQLIDLQRFEGAWVSLQSLEPVLRFKIPENVFNVEKDAIANKLWITLIVLSFLEHTMASHADVWELVVDKTNVWWDSMEARSVPEIEQMKKAAMEVVKKATEASGKKIITGNFLY